MLPFPQAAPAARIPAAVVRERLGEVLARNDLAERPSLLEQLIDWLAPNLSTGQVKLLGDVLVGIFAALAVIGLLLLVRRAWHAFRAESLEPARAEGTAPEDVRLRVRGLAEAARAARTAGDLRLALRLLFQALLLALGGRGDLELRAAWTQRELLRRGRPSREARALLEPLVRELEPKEFGRAAVEARDVERLERLLAPHLEAGGGGSAWAAR